MATITIENRKTNEMIELDLDALSPANNHDPVEFDEWVRLPEGIGYGNVVRKRYKTPNEIGVAMHAVMDLSVCKLCGAEKKAERLDWDKPCKCGGEWQQLLDEYDSWNDYAERGAHRPIAERTEEISNIICNCHVGGNEGYFAECGVLLRNQSNELRYVRLYWIKSFVGMDHVHALVKRMMLATGIWKG